MSQDIYSERPLFGGAITSTFPLRFQVGFFLFCNFIFVFVFQFFCFLFFLSVKWLMEEYQNCRMWATFGKFLITRLVNMVNWLCLVLHSSCQVLGSSGFHFILMIVRFSGWVSKGGICGPCPGRKLDLWALGIEAWSWRWWKCYLVSPRPRHWTRCWRQHGNSHLLYCLIIHNILSPIISFINSLSTLSVSSKCNAISVSFSVFCEYPLSRISYWRRDICIWHFLLPITFRWLNSQE